MHLVSVTSTSLVTIAATIALFSGPGKAAPLPTAAIPRVGLVAEDTIYRLAVDSNAYKEYPFVYLLDDGVAHYDADGRGTSTFHQVIQILKPSGVAQWAEQRISYQPDREKITMNWMRVVRPSGEVISEKPSQSQVSDVAASMSNPVYTTTKVVRYSLSNVAPGTLVDISWTKETTNPALPGDLLIGWNVTLPTPGMRSRFVLDLPATLAPHIVEHHLDFARTEVTKSGRSVITWARQNLKPVKGEIFAPDSSVPAMSIRIGAPLTWSEIGRWYNELSKDRYALSPALSHTVDSVVQNARNGTDTLMALHRWIAKDLRYVSISLGLGGYQPRFPEATVGTGYGDCKDKATLFIAAARHLGITAHPVLLNSNGSADKDFPAIEQFDHVIAAVERPGKPGYTYLDLTTFAFPAGEIPPSYQGAFGLMVFQDGSSQPITFPKDSAASSTQSFVGELSSKGRVSGSFSIMTGGSAATTMRAAYSEPLDSARRAALKRGAPKPFPGATVDTVILFDPKDQSVPPKIDIVLSDGEGAKSAGPLMILTLPASFKGQGGAYGPLIDELKKADKRQLPINTSELFPEGETRTELRLTLPDGWTAQLPKSVTANSAFGQFQSEYSQVGRELRVVHIMKGTKSVQPPESIGALIEWLENLAKDDAEYVPLTVKN